MLGIRPKMGVKPAELVRSSAAKSQPHKRLIWIENSKLREKLFGFACGFGKAEKRPLTYQRTRYGCDKFDDCLMRNPNGIFANSSAQEICRNLLLFRKSRIEPVHENVSIDQCRHEYTVPHASSLGRSLRFALMRDRARFRAGVVSGSPDRRGEAEPRDRLSFGNS